ncbi:hypothetical protein O1L60_45785 [Streptomyces diastatochromogenes]|nr:hypothetical protein [Streptomyces diastatochromogenes]
MAEADQVRVVGGPGLVDEFGNHGADIGGGDPGGLGDVVGLRVLGERAQQPQVPFGEVGDALGCRRRRDLPAGQYGVCAGGPAAAAGDAVLLADGDDVAGERRGADAKGLGALGVRRTGDQVLGSPLLGRGELRECWGGADLHGHGREVFRW